MSHKPLQFIHCTLAFNEKVCFENFNAQVTYGTKIAIIGRNGCGKSSLLKIIQGDLELSEGSVQKPGLARIEYIPQTIQEFKNQSGGERLFLSLQKAMRNNPEILLLDEPTNHLDAKNRSELFKILKNYQGTLFVVSHDPELLREHAQTIWFFDRREIHIFKGKYDDWDREIRLKKDSALEEFKLLNRQEKEIHENLMREQNRAAKSKKIGEKNTARKKVLLIQAHNQKSSAQKTSGRKKQELHTQKQEVRAKLKELALPEIIRPKFSITPDRTGEKTILSLRNAQIGYEEKTLIRDIALSISSRDRIALTGNNGSGKTTLLKAILRDPVVKKTGEWHLPRKEEIGYLDQHYETIAPGQTVLEAVESFMPGAAHAEIREYLNRFLFRKNGEVYKKASCLSGGEKVRLSLALIGAATPLLLILDEVTNNLDLEIRAHVIQMISEYSGALLVVSHDNDFLEQIGIKEFYEIKDSLLQRKG